MHLIVGLGNPGRQYAGSRHNLGYMVVEALARFLDSPPPEHNYRSLVSSAGYRGNRVILAQPLTYMNRSGGAVLALLRAYRLETERLLVVCDDLDLDPGVIRLRKKGGSAGHRGLQSIIDTLGCTGFPRLRLGCGKPPPGMEAAEYVLLPVTGPEHTLLEEAVERAVQAALLHVAEGIEAAMNHYNRRLPFPG